MQPSTKQVHQCTFALHIASGTGNIRFPCSFFVTWQTANGKQTSSPSQKVKKSGQMIPFDDNLTLNTHLLYDLATQAYLKKEANILVNLVSNSRPNQPKLVGRVTVDLAQVASTDKYASDKEHPLQYCSVNGSLTFSAVLAHSAPTTLSVNDLDRSEIGQLELRSSQKVIKLDGRKGSDGNNNIESRHKTVSFTSEMVGDGGKGWTGDQKVQSGLDTVSPRVKRELQSRGISLYQQHIGAGKTMTSTGRHGRSKLQIQVDGVEQQQTQPQIVVTPPSSIQATIPKSPSLNRLNSQDSPIRLPKADSKTAVCGEVEVLEGQIQRLSEERWRSEVERATLTEQLKKESEKREQLQRGIDSKQQQLCMLREQLRELNGTLGQQYNELRIIRDEGYPQQIQVLRRTLTLTQQQVNRFQVQLLQQEEHIGLLVAQNNRLKQQLQSYHRSVQQPQPVSISTAEGGGSQLAQLAQLQGEVSRLEGQLEQAVHRCQAENSNYRNTKQELREFQELSGQLQQQCTLLEAQNHRIATQLTERHGEVERLAVRARQLQSQLSNSPKEEQAVASREQLEKFQRSLHIKEQQVVALKELLSVCEQKQKNAQQQLQSASRVISSLQQQLQLQIAQVEQSHSRIQAIQDSCRKEEGRLQEEVERLRGQLEGLQAERGELVRRMETERTGERRQAVSGEAELGRKQKEIDNLRGQLEHFKRELELREDQQCEWQRRQEEGRVQLGRLRIELQGLRGQREQLQRSKAAQLSQRYTLNKQNSQLKAQFQSATHKYENSMVQLTHLNQSLTTQLSTLQAQHKTALSAAKYQQQRIVELSQKQQRWIERQRLLRQNLGLLEYECGKIGEVMAEKQENEEKWTEVMMGLKAQLDKARVRVAEVEACYELLMERNGGLEAQIQLLNTYQPPSEDSVSADLNTTMAELNKQLIAKNKDLMDSLQQKTSQVRRLEELLSQQQNQQGLEERMEQSRYRRQKRVAEEQAEGMREEVRQLERELERSNTLHDQQLAQLTLDANKKVKLLEQALQTAASQSNSLLRQKEAEYQLRQREFFELQQQIAKFESAIGQYELKLHIANQKVVELQQQIQVSQQVINQMGLENKMRESDREEEERWRERVQQLQKELNQLHQKEFVYEQEILTLGEKLEEAEKARKIQQAGSKQHQQKLKIQQNQLQLLRQRQKELFLQISTMKQKQNSYESTSQQLEKVRLQMEEDEAHFSQEFLIGKVQARKNQQNGTPINTFAHSPAQLSSVCLQDIAEQMSSLLEKRKRDEELESALRLIIENSGRQEEEMQRWNTERGLIQEKARLASKEMQKVKAGFLRLPDRTMAQKSQLTSALRPVEKAVGEIVGLSEALAEIQLNQQEMGQEGQGYQQQGSV